MPGTCSSRPTCSSRWRRPARARPVAAFGTLVERIEINLTDPSPDLPEGERATARASAPVPHRRKRPQGAVDGDRPRAAGRDRLRSGRAVRPATSCPRPSSIASDNTECLTQDIEGAKALLDEAGWTDSDGDGIRDKDGEKLSLLFQSSTNAVRQDFQALIKQWWNEIGVETELRNVDVLGVLRRRPGPPDTFQKFYADVEMYANNFDGTDPQAYLGAVPLRQRRRVPSPVAGREHQPLLQRGIRRAARRARRRPASSKSAARSPRS